MSMNYSADTALGCRIVGEDAKYFIREYMRINPKECEDEYEMMDWLALGEAFTASDGSNMTVQDMAGYFGMGFMPANPKDTNFWEEEGEYEYNGYYLFAHAEKWIGTRSVFSGKFYSSYEELKVEFIRKLGAYLPKDFDYDANIGDLHYVIYG